jgi:hypothetical protein
LRSSFVRPVRLEDYSSRALNKSANGAVVVVTHSNSSNPQPTLMSPIHLLSLLHTHRAIYPSSYIHTHTTTQGDWSAAAPLPFLVPALANCRRRLPRREHSVSTSHRELKTTGLPCRGAWVMGGGDGHTLGGGGFDQSQIHLLVSMKFETKWGFGSILHMFDFITHLWCLRLVQKTRRSRLARKGPQRPG